MKQPRLFFVLLWLVAAAPSVLLAAPPAIDGPEAVDAGKPVVLSTPVDEHAAYRWQTIGGDAELITFRVCGDDGAAKQICLLNTTAAGTYRIQLIRATINDDTMPVIDIAEHAVTIGQPPADPPPIPPQTPSVEQTVAALAREVGDPATAVNLAAVFSIVAGQNHATPEAFAAATDAAVGLVVKGKGESWQAFLGGLETILNELSAAGKLATVDDHKRIWGEISSGLLRATK